MFMFWLMSQLESFTIALRIINHLVVIFSSRSQEATLYWTAAPGSCTPQEGHIPIFGRSVTAFCFCRGLSARPKKGRRMEQMPTPFTPFPWRGKRGGSFSSTQLRRESGQTLTSLLSLLHKWLSNILKLCRAVSHNPATLPETVHSSSSSPWKVPFCAAFMKLWWICTCYLEANI